MISMGATPVQIQKHAVKEKKLIIPLNKALLLVPEN